MHPLQHRPAEVALERVQPERGLVVGDRAGGAGPVAERRRRLHVAAGRRRDSRPGGRRRSRASAAVAKHPRHEAAEEPLDVVVRVERLLDRRARSRRC